MKLPKRQEKILTEILKAAVGESLVISIPANPTSCYMWKIEFCDSLLECSELPYHRLSETIGGGGAQKFEVTARQAGEFEIRFISKRPWETEAEEVRIYRIFVKQKPEGEER